jgi:hypothetical protein
MTSSSIRLSLAAGAAGLLLLSGCPSTPPRSSPESKAPRALGSDSRAPSIPRWLDELFPKALRVHGPIPDDFADKFPNATLGEEEHPLYFAGGSTGFDLMPANIRVFGKPALRTLEGLPGPVKKVVYFDVRGRGRPINRAALIEYLEPQSFSMLFEKKFVESPRE